MFLVPAKHAPIVNMLDCKAPYLVFDYLQQDYSKVAMKLDAVFFSVYLTIFLHLVKMLFIIQKR